MRIPRTALMIAGLATSCTDEFPIATDTAASTPAPVHPLYWPSSGGLEYSNGDKIVRGNFNSLHAVHQSGLYIRYATSLDGVNWTNPESLNTTPSQYPAIAADSNGTIAVVWVSNIGANGLGTIHYAYKPAASTTWTKSALITSGTEPAVVARGGKVHIAWTTFQMVQYTSFPTVLPPAAPLSGGEVLEASGCPNTGFRKPSITLIQNPCNPPIPRVAYLYYSDEQATAGLCQSFQTKVGPRVCQRHNAMPTWSTIYEDIIDDTTPSSSVDPISISITANFKSGDTFLAWSDEQSGTARTMLAHGAGVSWTTVPHDDQRHLVHVRAANTNTAPATRFRFAWSGETPWAADGHYDTATWTGAAPAWTEVYDLAGATPQALFWNRCDAGTYSTTNAHFEFLQTLCSGTALATDYSSTTGCPAVTLYPVDTNLCLDHVAAIAAFNTPLTPLTIVDIGALGAVKRFGRNSAVIGTPRGGTVLVSWPSNTSVVSTSDETFTLSAPKSAVRFSSTDVTFRVEDFGTLVEYDQVQAPAPPRQCGPR